MADLDDAVATLARAVPPKVREVCMTLAEAGHEAVIVGGCVRDVLMGRTPGDWDVASSAHPNDVMKLFRRTVPQGLQHGTVKVLMGKGKENEVEVTAFRGEGAYSDARRPDSVTFGVPLVEDLARRDLVVNAIAFDPAKNVLVDPFGGRDDIARRRLRAVGNAVDRFTEDGLRVMRAVRFAAQLEFELDPETEAGIVPALPSLSKVSRERVCEELRKTLRAREPSRGLAPALRTGIIGNILPEVTSIDVPRIDRAHPDVRLTVLMLGVTGVDDVLRRLKFSNHEIDVASQLLRVAAAPDAEPVAVRRALARVGRHNRSLAVELWRSQPADVSIAEHVLAEKHPLAAGDLVITGKDLISELGLPPGPAIGRILEALVAHVLEEPSRNTRDGLLAVARDIARVG